MKSLIKDESADSMIIVVIATSILAFGLFFILFSYTLNVPIGAMNDLIASGMITEDTSSAYELCLNLWRISPFFMLVGLVIYCYGNATGSGVSAQTFFEYLLLMMIGVFTSTYLVFSFGIALDGITINLDNSMLTDVSAEWDSTGERNILITMLYYFTFLPAFITELLYILHPILKQRETRFIYGADRETDEDDFGEIELGQV